MHVARRFFGATELFRLVASPDLNRRGTNIQKTALVLYLPLLFMQRS